MTIKLTKRQRKELVLPRARQMADSGKFANWYAIEQELRFGEGLPEARQLLDDEFIREDLDRRCKRALANA